MLLSLSRWFRKYYTRCRSLDTLPPLLHLRNLKPWLHQANLPSPQNQPKARQSRHSSHLASLTIDKSLHAGSEGCAPTPSQYFARAVSSLMSLWGLPWPRGAGLGMGSYVPGDQSDEGWIDVGWVGY